MTNEMMVTKGNVGTVPSSLYDVLGKNSFNAIITTVTKGITDCVISKQNNELQLASIQANAILAHEQNEQNYMKQVKKIEGCFDVINKVLEKNYDFEKTQTLVDDVLDKIMNN